MDRLDIKRLIKDKKTGLYLIDINDKEIIEKNLDEARAEGLLQENRITYTYTIHENYISLILSRAICKLVKE